MIAEYTGRTVAEVPRYFTGILFTTDGEPGPKFTAVKEPAATIAGIRCLGRSAFLNIFNAIGYTAVA